MGAAENNEMPVVVQYDRNDCRTEFDEILDCELGVSIGRITSLLRKTFEIK